MKILRMQSVQLSAIFSLVGYIQYKQPLTQGTAIASDASIQTSRAILRAAAILSRRALFSRSLSLF